MGRLEFADPADDEAVVERLVALFEASAKPRLALPGGRTPLPILQRLAEQWRPSWSGEAMLTDDRLVPSDHPASNLRLLHETLGRTALSIRPLHEGDWVERFDLVWVGMGADGHVASLFPGTVDVAAPANVVRIRPDPLPPEAPFERLSLTLSALAAADAIIIVARGPEKLGPLREAAEGRSHLPVGQLVAAASCPVTVYWQA